MCIRDRCCDVRPLWEAVPASHAPVRRPRRPAPRPADLAPASAAAVEDFRRHLAAERGLSTHTVRAYVADVCGLLEHADRMGVDDPAGLGIVNLRSWLARQRASGSSRATLARLGPTMWPDACGVETTRCSSCFTLPVFGSASCAGWTRTMSTSAGEWCAYWAKACLLYTSPSPRDRTRSRM